MKNTHLLILSLTVLGAASVSGQVLFSGNYFQDFNTLQNTPNVDANTVGAPTWTNNSTLPGWYGGGNAPLAAGYGVGNGSDTTMLAASTVAVASFGTTGNSDRALAPLKRNTSAYIALALTNNTGATLTEVDVSYIGEQWRDNAVQTAGLVGLNFDYQVGATDITSGTWTAVAALNFDAPSTSNLGTLDGNLPANSQSLSATITGLTLAQGETIWLRWNQRGSGNNGSYVAIDNVSVIPEPSTYAALIGLLALGFVAWRRRR